MPALRCIAIVIAALGAATAAVGADETPSLEKTRSALEQWVDLRKAISEEQNDWRSDRETLGNSIALIKSEMERIDAAIAESEEKATAAEKARRDREAESESLQRATATVAGALPGIEARVHELHEFFPAELRRKVALLHQRIPKPGQPTRASVAERLQYVVGLLSEAEKFNNAITVTSELQPLPDGSNGQVDAIYIGLGVGFFVDGSGAYAGVLQPARGGWKVEARNELAPAIRRAISIYKGDPNAEFVPLPVEIR
jgi:hypothetical protein